MNDKNIVELYLSRDEGAVRTTIEKYQAYCHSIAFSILNDEQNAEEALNDTWLGAWNSIPPHQPENLATYLGKLTRNISLTKYRNLHASKRYADTVSLATEELEECLPSRMTVESEIESAELGKIIDNFIDGLPDIEQRVFVCRYFYFDSTSDISKRFGFSESKVKSMLHRIRRKLKRTLNEEDIWI